MGTLLVRDIHTLATMDATRRELRDAAIYVRDNVIVAVGDLRDMPSTTADRVINGRRHVVLPGLVNTHHHLFQTLTRALAQQADLFAWLKTVYPVWARLTADAAYVSAKVGMAELMLSGCTTTSDHLYLFPNDVRLDDTIRAGRDMGMRFHATRGAMSVGESAGGLPPDALVEDEDAILADTRRVIESFHDAGRFAMTRIAVAPCSPFSVSRELMRDAAALARSYGVGMHTHLAENDHDVAYSLERFGCHPGHYAESVGWTGPDVWHAHCVKLDDAEIERFSRTHTGVCHCPASNLRLGSGRAPVARMRRAGLRVGIGVDGAASNDGGHLVAEARLALLLSRVSGDVAALSARDALELATLGGASVLNRDDIGTIAPGMAADVIGFRLDTPAFAGALHDPVAALLLCAPASVDFSVIDGTLRVSDGRLVEHEMPALLARHNALSAQMLAG
jgi:cytosine/adenosine deaminase-related metal-dependent hydrolase